MLPHLRIRTLSSGTAGTRNGARASLAQRERSSPAFLLSLATGGILHGSEQALRDAQATNHGKKWKMLHPLMLGPIDTSYQSRPKLGPHVCILVLCVGRGVAVKLLPHQRTHGELDGDGRMNGQQGRQAYAYEYV
jgi:hypothetical protein